MKFGPKVLFVSNSSSGGGAERAANLIVNSLYLRGMSISLCTINEGPLDLFAPSCPTLRLNRRSRSGIYETVVAMFRFRSMVKRYRPEVVVFGCELPELFALTLPGRFQKIVVLHTSEPWIGRRILGKLVRFLLSQHNVSWIAVSEHLKVWPLNRLPDAVIPNPVITLGTSWNANQSKLEKISRLVFVGRLSEEKQPHLVLELSKLTRLPSLFIGTGNLEEELRSIADKNSLQTHFSGYVLNPWAEVFIGDLLIVPSRFEGDGLVILEAIRNKVPLVLNDVPDLRRFGLDDDFYFKSISDLAAEIMNGSLNLSRLIVPVEAQNRILRGRDLENVADMWERYFVHVNDTYRNN